MGWNRNKCLWLGALLLLLGAECRLVQRVTFNTAVTKKLYEYHHGQTEQPAFFQRFMVNSAGPEKHVVEIPPWLGLALISVGAVLALQSFVMEKPSSGGGGDLPS